MAVRLCSYPAVRLQQAAKELLTLDLADGAVNGHWDGLAGVDMGWDSLPNPLMRPVHVVEAPIATHNPAQALEAKEDEAVQTLLTAARRP